MAKSYRKRQFFTEAEKESILLAYRTQSAAVIAQQLNATNPQREVPVTDQHIYAVLRAARRTGENTISLLLAAQQFDQAKKMEGKMVALLPHKKNANSNIMQQIIEKVIGDNNGQIY